MSHQKHLWFSLAALATLPLLLVDARLRAARTGYQPRTPILVSRDLLPSSLAIATNSHCSVCLSSLEFYRTLAGLRIVWIATAESEDATSGFLQKGGVDTLTVLSARAVALPINGTPTVFAIDEDRHVARIWIGRLDREAQIDVLAHMSRVRSLMKLLHLEHRV